MDFEDNHDHTVPAPLTEAVQVSWSVARSWHGETVTIRVRTARVPDGDTVQLKIRPVGNPEFDTLPGLGAQPLRIAKNALDHNYVIDWKTKAVPPASVLFEVTAQLVELQITSAPSEPMAVDLIPPLFSA